MEKKVLRAAVVGASTLQGREVVEQLAASAATLWEITLLDEPTLAGQLTAAGDEPLVVQALHPGAFRDVDVVFFAGDSQSAKAHWKEAQLQKALIVDITGTLESEPGAVVMSSLAAGSASQLTKPEIAVSAHPAAIMLAQVEDRLRRGFGHVRLIATVHQPASQHGKAGIDELQGQTTALLSFQPVARDVYGSQVAFNLQARLGAESKVNLAEETGRILRHFATLSGGGNLEMLLIQAPVFYGFTASVYVDLERSVSHEEIQEALEGSGLHVSGNEDNVPSNVTATEQADMLVAILEGKHTESRSGWWLWLSVDNVGLAARNAIAIASSLSGAEAVSESDKGRGCAVN